MLKWFHLTLSELYFNIKIIELVYKVGMEPNFQIYIPNSSGSSNSPRSICILIKHISLKGGSHTLGSGFARLNFHSTRYNKNATLYVVHNNEMAKVDDNIRWWIVG